MKTFLIIIFISFILNASVLAYGIAPKVVIFENNQAVKLEVGSTIGDTSWMNLFFDNPIDITEYQQIEVSFDIYRFGDTLNNSVLSWSFQNLNSPYYGRQEGNFIYPLNVGRETIITDQYVTTILSWNFTSSVSSSYYNINSVDTNIPLPVPIPFNILTDFYLSLHGTSSDSEIIFIDNFSVFAYNNSYSKFIIHDYFAQDNLELGSLNGQGITGMGNWISGNSNPVPIPSTFVLLLFGILGLFKIKY